MRKKFIIFFAFFVLKDKITHNSPKDNYNTYIFNLINKSFDGKIEEVHLYKIQNHFKLKNESKEFYFYYCQKYSPFTCFSEVAKIGDRVYKNKYSDTIYLIHHNEKYIYILTIIN